MSPERAAARVVEHDDDQSRSLAELGEDWWYVEVDDDTLDQVRRLLFDDWPAPKS